MAEFYKEAGVEGERLGGYTIEINEATHFPKMWTWLIQSLEVKTILDVGCGMGFSTKFFHDSGCDVLGIEGCKNPTINGAIPDKMVHCDLYNGPYVHKEVDLIWCCEVLEHIDEEYLPNVLETFKQAKYLAVTAAKPGQGGHHHVNLRKSSYWITKMQEIGYTLDAGLTRVCRQLSCFDAHLWSDINNHFDDTGLIFKRDEPRDYTEAVALTYLSGDKFFNQKMVDVYLKSIGRYFPGDLIVFTHDLNIENREKLEDLGFRIIDTYPDEVLCVVLDRWYPMWKFLCNEGQNYKYVVVTDAKDVVFQDNPVDFLKTIDKEEFLLLHYEGMNHEDCEWNKRDQAALQEDLRRKHPFDKAPIFNGGSQAGTPRRLKEFAFLIWSGMYLHMKQDTVTERREKKGWAESEQALLNYLCFEMLKDPSVVVADPSKDWYGATGEPIKLGLANHPTEFKDGKIINPTLKRPYSLVHQWERTAYRDDILNSY